MSRVKPDYLRAYLSDPRAVKPGSTMPNLLAGLAREEAEADIEALVHFLATTGTAVETAPNRKAIGLGKNLFEQSGCAACHGMPDEKGPTLPSTIRLGDATGKYTVGSLAAFLQDPLAVRPSGRMPSLNLKPVEAQAVASYLFKDVHVDMPPNLAYRYYEGEWADLPDFDKLAPVKSGMAEGFDLGVANRHGDYAIRFEGVIRGRARGQLHVSPRLRRREQAVPRRPARGGQRRDPPQRPEVGPDPGQQGTS